MSIRISLTAEPGTIEETGVDPLLLDETDDSLDGNWSVILYDDEYHSMLEVVVQLLKATAHSRSKCHQITLEAHTRGRAVAFTGTELLCTRCAAILREIDLKVEVDRF